LIPLVRYMRNNMEVGQNGNAGGPRTRAEGLPYSR
jgi:hypothetical protein